MFHLQALWCVSSSLCGVVSLRINLIFKALVLKVCDAVTKEVIVEYSLPVSYLKPFHHYHLELVHVSLYIYLYFCFFFQSL